MRISKLWAVIAACSSISYTAMAEQTELVDTTVSASASFDISRSVLTDRSKTQLNTFIGLVDSVLRYDRLLSVNISGSSSPDGPLALNKRLSEERARVVRNYFINNSVISADNFALQAKGEDWERFESLVREDSSIPNKQKLLEIITSSKSPQIKESEMRRLDNGRTWKYLAQHIFPKVRVAIIDVSYLYSPPMRQIVPVPEVVDTLKHDDANEIVADTIIEENVVEPLPDSSPAYLPEWQRHAYVKTNMPAWLMLWINAAGEIDIAPHWSANLSLYYSGYNYFKGNLKFRTFAVMPEIRYWPLARNDGFFVGGHFGMAYYNVAFCGDKRYQDHDGNTPALGGGINIGYRFALPKNPRWKMEFSIGAGAYRLDYDVFANHYNGLIIGREKRTFFGIDNAAFSICYTFDVKRKGGIR